VNNSDSIVVVLAHPNTDISVEMIKRCISSIAKNNFKFEILLSCNFPVNVELQHIVDYVIYDKKNPLLYSDEFSKVNSYYSMSFESNGRVISKYFPFEHGYSVYLLMKNAIEFCFNVLDKKKIHIVNYDCILRDGLLDVADLDLDSFDVVAYSVGNESSHYKTTFFSIKESCSEFWKKFNSKINYYQEYSEPHNTLKNKLFEYLSKNSNIKIMKKTFDEYNMDIDETDGISIASDFLDNFEKEPLPINKVLFLCTHLSTGGMPEYLRMRIEALRSNSTVDIWVVEYSLYSQEYTIQRNKIIELVGKDRFISLGWFSDNINENYRKFEILRDLIATENFDIIHLDDIIESIESFNKFHPKLISLLYSTNEDSQFRIIETPHSSTFCANSNKLYIPDGFLYCSNYHLYNDFDELNKTIPNSVVEYPIVDFRNVETDVPYEFSKFKYNIVNVGLWTPGKNQKEIVEIARYLETQYPGVYGFHFLGNMAGNFESYWKPIIQNLPNNVILHYERDDVYKYLKNCDLFIFSSLLELNPIVLKEALSFGCKILMRNLPIYGNVYDNFVKYMVDDIETNGQLIQNILSSENIIEYNEFDSDLKYLSDLTLDFYKTVKSHKKSASIRMIEPNEVSVFHRDGNIGCEISGTDLFYRYVVYFKDKNTNALIYQTTLNSGMWAMPNKLDEVDWQVVVDSENPFFKKFVYNS
jgi:hypothetical protein